MTFNRLRGSLVVLALLNGCDPGQDPPLPSRIEFLDAPPAAIAATDPAITIRVGFVTSTGDIVTDVSDTVHLELEGITESQVEGSMSAAAVDGIATFQLQVQSAGDGLRFTARTARFDENAESPIFTVLPGPATGLDVDITPPPNSLIQAGGVNTLVARIVDALGNTVPTDSRTVTLTSPTPLLGTSSVSTVAGIARFTDFSICPSGLPGGISSYGAPMTVEASASGLAPHIATFTIYPGIATHAVWTKQPADGRVGIGLPEFVLQIRDCGENPVIGGMSGWGGCVTEFENNPTGATISTGSRWGTGASFGHIGAVVDKPGTGYTLKAQCSRGALTVNGPPSAPFNVLP